MAKLYRYKPADNRTPVHHKTIGHLQYGEVYDHPDCAGNPDFEEVKTSKKPAAKPGERTRPARAPKVRDPEPKPVENSSPVSEAEPGTPENPIVPAPVGTPDGPEPPAITPADADTGRSN